MCIGVCGAFCCLGKKIRVVLVARADEGVAELLHRLGVPLGKALAEGVVIDEVLPEMRRRNAS
jgi:hypothetical protein